MQNPAIKAKRLTLVNVANQILALPPGQFTFDRWFDVNLPFSVASVKYGLTQNEYNYLFKTGAANIGPTSLFCGNMGPTTKDSTAKQIASHINKFVAAVAAVA